MNNKNTWPKNLTIAILFVVTIRLILIDEIYGQEELVRLEKSLRNFVAKSVENNSFQKVEAVRLLGYTEGTLNVDIPDFWEAALCSSRVDEQARFVFGSTSFESNFETKDLKLFWTRGFKLNITENSLLQISKNEEMFQIKDYDAEHQSIRFSNRKVLLKTMSFAIVNDNLVVANWNYNDDTLNVFTVNKEGDVQWDVELEIETHDQNIVSRLVSYGCEIRESDSGLIIFGTNYPIGFVFCLEHETGLPLMKFKTTNKPVNEIK